MRHKLWYSDTEGFKYGARKASSNETKPGHLVTSMPPHDSCVLVKVPQLCFGEFYKINVILALYISQDLSFMRYKG